MPCKDVIKDLIISEYEVVRSGLEQGVWLEGILAQVRDCESVEADFRSKRRPFKKFVEEAIPICRVVSQVDQYKNSLIKIKSGNERHDAEIMNGHKEYFEIVNSRNGHYHSKLMALLNDSIGIIGGIPGRTTTETLIKDIEDKINHGYSNGVYHLIVCFDFDQDIFNLDVILNNLRDRFRGQTAFKTIFLYETRNKTVNVLLQND